MFIYFFKSERERERMSAHKWGGAETRRDRIPSRLHTINAEPNAGLNSRTARSWPRSRLGHLTD